MAELPRGSQPSAFHYRAYNLRVCSELEVPGAQVLDDPNAEFASEPAAKLAPELTIVTGAAHLAGQLRPWGPYTVSAHGLLFEQPGVARYSCTEAGTKLTVEPLPGANAAAVADYLIATALPAALWMRGDIVLHAAAAVLGGQKGAIAFAGASGSGKSSLLHELLRHGASIVAEDSLCLRAAGNAIEASGLPAALLLRRAQDQLNADRDILPVPPTQRRSAADLAAVVMLSDSSTSSNGVPQRLSSGRALEALLRHRHRATVPHLLGLEAALLPRFVALACAVPVYLWHRPRPRSALSSDEVQALRELAG